MGGRARCWCEALPLVYFEELAMRYPVPARNTFFLLALVMILLLSACGGLDTGSLGSAGGPNPTPQLTLEQAEQVAQTFLKAWADGDYAAMYTLISPNSREVYSEEAFVQDYQETAVQLTLTSLETSIISSLRQGTTAALQYDVRFHTELFGVIEDLGRTLRLIETPEGWRVAWSRMDIRRPGGRCAPDPPADPAQPRQHLRPQRQSAGRPERARHRSIPGAAGHGQRG